MELSTRGALSTRLRLPALLKGDLRTLPQPALQHGRRSVTLVHDETMDQWAEWFAAAGVQPPEFPNGPAFPNCELATSGVEQGLGVSLAYDIMVRETIASGRLVRLFEPVTIPFVIYSFVCQRSRAAEPLIAAFREFVVREVAPDARPTFAVVAQ